MYHEAQSEGEREEAQVSEQKSWLGAVMERQNTII